MLVDSRTADRLTGMVLLMLGIAMLAGGYTMDRLEIRQIHPASIPGLVPMGLGLAMIICSVLLLVSTASTTDTSLPEDSAVSEDSEKTQPGSFKNLALTIVLCLAYAGGLLGKMPFAVATGIFIFMFSAVFSWPEKSVPVRARIKPLLLIALFAVVFAVGISTLFQYGFLVRLP
ncbi:tripartite tricarboxylate transporter TctB family protein [Granulosicoccus antarcticus]|uniref:DUF1468 domain-containing protein n=1 Tax=Granulosicoccus antarcticus IMCC3135 TaxID=1192854 RepID=A0A2Z2NPG0_9GAMM|nr:tripartite tricarboxylate transporter TctB family protein [Granulosicoccus antarcticus]ASJ73326.1 hypothetical protein IMCC3135_16220 [Granulosicoccus antarcticus IMCC3135]